MTRAKEKPCETTVERGGTERTHPAFGQIGAFRATGGGWTLYGSPIKHNSTVRITIKESKEIVDLHRQWHSAGKVVADVVLSEAQWAAFVSSMNVGDGVPCTITYRCTERFVRVPDINDESDYERRAAMIREQVAEHMAQFSEISEEVKRLRGLKAIRKSDLDRLAHLVLKCVDQASGAYEFAADMVTEHMEHVVASAKAEVNAFVAQAAARFPEIKDGMVGLLPRANRDDE